MRHVQVFKRERINGKVEMVSDGKAVFHQFSQDHEEYDNGPGMVPVAIVEFPDGSLASRSLELVRFID